MKNYLRYLFIAVLALVCGGAFADSMVTFNATTDKSDSKTLSKDGVTITIGDGALGNGTEYRIYKGQKATITSETGTITKIVFTCTANGTAKYGPGSFGTLEGYTFETSGKTGTWKGTANSVEFTASSNQVRATKIEVTVANSGATKSAANLIFSEETINYEVGTEFTAPTFTKATNATATFISDNEDVATVNSEGVISLGDKEGKAIITATSEENDEYYSGSATCTIYVYHMNTYKQATTIESGKGYILVAKRDDNTYYAMPLSSTAEYGYVNTSKITGDAEKISIKSTYDDEFIFTTEGEGYSIKDNLGRYYTQSGTFNSFQLATEAGAWTIEPQTDGTFKIEMNGYYIQFGEGKYTSFGIYNEAKDNTVLPYLYELDSTPTAISTITSDATANAPAYNLAGQKVSASYKGVVIKAGKKFVQK